MIKSPHIFMNVPGLSSDDLRAVVDTITLNAASTSPGGLVADSMAQSWPSVAIGAGFILVVIFALSRLGRRARQSRLAANERGESFAASIDIPPYIDTSNLADAAASVNPKDATDNLAQIWSEAERKAAANPLYSPTPTERLARDAVAIERIFCSGQLAKTLAKLPRDDFDRYSAAADTLGAEDIADLIVKAKTLAARGHSADMKERSRKGPEWQTFRRDIADLETYMTAANTWDNKPGRLVALAHAYLAQIVSRAA